MDGQPVLAGRAKYPGWTSGREQGLVQRAGGRAKTSSTAHPQRSRRKLSSAANSATAKMTGGISHVRGTRLAAAVEAVMPVLRATSAKVHHLSPGGAGRAMKMVLNLMIA